jgi:hypothetical protein
MGILHIHRLFQNPGGFVCFWAAARATRNSHRPHSLGLIYCSLSGGFIYRSFQDLNFTLVLNDLYTQVKTIGDQNYSRDQGQYEALEKKVQFGQRLGYLNAIIDGIIGIICLWSCFGRSARGRDAARCQPSRSAVLDYLGIIKDSGEPARDEWQKWEAQSSRVKNYQSRTRPTPSDLASRPYLSTDALYERTTPTGRIGKMPSPSAAAPAELLLRCHLGYEIWMLQETYRRCPNDPNNTARDDDTVVRDNSLIESFCVHARNLIELF